MHQQPPRPHQDADVVEPEPASPSRPGPLDALRYSKAGSMIGRPPLTVHAASAGPDRPGQDNQPPARSPLSLTLQTPQLATQQVGSMLSPAAPSLLVGGPGMSTVRFPDIDQAAGATPVQAPAQQQSNGLWSASAHLQAVELLLDAAQHTSSSPQVALQHLQSISLLCQSCRASLSSVQAAGRAAAPLQSMQSICDSATETALQQAHAQHALWVSLRLLCRTVAQAFES